MDQNEKKSAKNPRENANIFSILSFGWLFPTFITGYKRDLEEDDIYSPLREHASTVLGDRMEDLWRKEVEKNKEKNSSKPSLLKILFTCFKKWIIIIGVVQALWEFLLRISQPLILAKLLRYLSHTDNTTKEEMYYWTTGYIMSYFLDAYLQHFTLMGLGHLGLKFRVACTTLIYRKILRLSSTVLDNGTSAGQMVNLINNDVNRLDYMVYSIHYFWIGPLQTVIVAYLVWREIGWSAVVGMLIFLVFIPVQVYFGKKVAKLTHLSMYRTDERLSLMNEVIAGIEVIKMYVWEKPFSLLVGKARREEVNVMQKTSITEQITFTFDLYVPRFCVFVTILAYVLDGNHIDAEKVYLVTAYYSVLRNSMSLNFSMCIMEIAEGLVALKRLQKFMLHPEVETKPTSNERETENTSAFAISLKNVTAKWSSEAEDDTLADVNLSVKRGKLVAVVGQVGAGKSSLLQVILRELRVSKGSLETHGEFSYANQLPWIFASSVKQNILFGKPMDQARYERTLQICQLKPDIASFSHGDRTLVGPRGISLSGGQRARINLARAIYAEADIYLLDDPLSAVDSHVGRRIMEDCICGYLKDKTRILVTHQVQYLGNVDLVIVMSNGRIIAQGSYDDLCDAGIDLGKLIETENEKKTSDAVDEKTVSPYSNQNGMNPVSNGDTMDSKAKTEDPIDVDEKKALGRISTKVYINYFKATRNFFLVFLMLLMIVISQSIATGGDYFLAFWVNVEETSNFETINGTTTSNWQGSFPRPWFIYIYCAIVIATVFFCLNQLFFSFVVFMRAAKNLHADMFRSVTRTSMIFFNVNPAGRILNRFSKDTYVVDKRIPLSLFDVLLMICILSTVIVVIGVVNPILLIPLIFIGIIFYFLRSVYVSTSRCVKRLEGVTRSPVNDHVSVTLQGLSTVRAFKAEDKLSGEFDKHHDVNTSAYYMSIATSRAFGLYLHIFCLVYIGIITFLFVIYDDEILSADAGLILTQCISLAMLLQWGMRQTAEVECNMISVERIQEYSRLEEEPNLDSKPEKKPPNDWPRTGHVEFKDVQLKYSPTGNYMLKGVSFEIFPKEKIGIVGRTGAGKTSLISALFRLAIVEGDIVIDGISTGSIGLHDFRSKISIIPQEPVLFAGKLRQNLDPFDEFPDELLWQALQEVELKDFVSTIGLGLDTRIAEGGANFSVGQRQLLCLARALVRKNKIMVLDEATANVDSQTDSLIQTTVRKKFRDCTVLTIAHRLHTVMDSDKVLVMNAGNLVEFDSPYNLLQRRGLFFSMVEQTGPSMAATLTKIAENTYFNVRNEEPAE